MSSLDTVDTGDVTPRGGRLRRRAASVAIVAIGMGLLGTLYAAVAPHGSATATPEIQAGRQLFLQGCSTCHGLNGEGGVRSPSLIGVGAAAVDFQMGTGRMPLANPGPEAIRRRQTRYNETQIEQIATYVASLGPGPAIPTNLDYQQADTAFGGILFRTNCAQCHNFAGSGGELTYGKYAPSLSQSTPKEIYEAMITGPENMPVFGDGQITPSQKLAIIGYIRGIKTDHSPGGAGLGRVGPVSETLVILIAGIGGLVLFTLWIGSRA